MFPAAADHLNSCVHLERATIIPGNRKIAFNICVSEVEHAGVFCLLHLCDPQTPSVTATWWLWCVWLRYHQVHSFKQAHVNQLICIWFLKCIQKPKDWRFYVNSNPLLFCLKRMRYAVDPDCYWFLHWILLRKLKVCQPETPHCEGLPCHLLPVLLIWVKTSHTFYKQGSHSWNL